MFAILKQLATQEIDIIGEGVVEVLSTVSAFYDRRNRTTSPGRTTSTSARAKSAASACARRYRRRPYRSPKEGERYFALLKVNTINFETPRRRATRSTSTT